MNTNMKHIPDGSPYGYDAYLQDMKQIIASDGCVGLIDAMESTKGHLPYDVCQSLLDEILVAKTYCEED